jgi:hypothetical protein
LKFLIKSNWRAAVPHLILLVAFALQLYHLDAPNFHGDEFGSLNEALELGKNANSLPYFAFLRAFLFLGDGEFWTRFLSVCCAVLTIAVTFRWASRSTSPRLARSAIVLLATSPFLLVYAQQLRFYAFALLAASISMWAFVEWLKQPQPKRLAVWFAAAVFAVAALFLNALAVLAQAVTAFWLTPRWKRRAKIFVLLGMVGVIALITLLPAVRAAAFNALAAYTNAESRYEISRGLSLSTLAKIPLTLFFFIFGESVYPLHLWLVVPGLIVFGAAAILGLVYLVRFPQIFVFVITAFALGLGLLYLVFDPLAPPTLQGAAPRYLIFLLPIFYLVVAAGTRFSKTRWLLVPLLLVNFAGLALYWQGDWSYTDDLVDWRAMGQRVAENSVLSVAEGSNAQTDVIADGRAYELTKRYVPSKNPISKLGEYAPRAETARIILLTNDYHAERRADADAFLENIRGDFELTQTWSQYPTFLFVLNRRAAPQKNFAVDAQTGRVETMPELYGLEFQDARLPLNANLNGNLIALPGPFVLNEQPRAFSLAQPTQAQTLWLLSQVVGASATNGAPLATLQIDFADGSRQVVPIRLGQETAVWNSTCGGECVPVASWRKRAALLGTSAYPDSWREFDAQVFGAPIVLNSNARVTRIALERANNTGDLYVWGLVLQ